MLQRFAENIEYHELINKALEDSNSVNRMQYICAFYFSMLTATLNRLKKPFNPLLGETYEYVDSTIKYFSE